VKSCPTCLRQFDSGYSDCPVDGTLLVEAEPLEVLNIGLTKLTDESGFLPETAKPPLVRSTSAKVVKLALAVAAGILILAVCASNKRKESRLSSPQISVEVDSGIDGFQQNESPPNTELSSPDDSQLAYSGGYVDDKVLGDENYASRLPQISLSTLIGSAEGESSPDQDSTIQLNQAYNMQSFVGEPTEWSEENPPRKSYVWTQQSSAGGEIKRVLQVDKTGTVLLLDWSLTGEEAEKTFRDLLTFWKGELGQASWEFVSDADGRVIQGKFESPVGDPAENSTQAWWQWRASDTDNPSGTEFSIGIGYTPSVGSEKPFVWVVAGRPRSE
jgi:hypothetical protein